MAFFDSIARSRLVFCTATNLLLLLYNGVSTFVSVSFCSASFQQQHLLSGDEIVYR